MARGAKCKEGGVSETNSWLFEWAIPPYLQQGTLSWLQSKLSNISIPMQRLFWLGIKFFAWDFAWKSRASSVLDFLACRSKGDIESCSGGKCKIDNSVPIQITRWATALTIGRGGDRASKRRAAPLLVYPLRKFLRWISVPMSWHGEVNGCQSVEQRIHFSKSI